MAGARKIVVDGKDITAELNTRFMALELSDESGQQSDSLTITLSDDGKVKYPGREAEIQLWLGATEQSLVYRGFFTVDDVDLGFAPYTITISASAARMRGTFVAPKDDSWDDISVAALVTAVANRNSLQAAAHEKFTSITLAHREQVAQSDSDFLTRLADELDATMKVTKGRLVFFPKGDGANVSGQLLPPVPVPLSAATQGSVKLKGRLRYQSVRAQYRNLESANTGSAVAGEGAPEKLLPGVYDTQDQAQRSAEAAFHQLSRKEFVFAMRRMPANPQIMAERLVTVSGHFRDQVNGDWLVEQYTETQDEQGYWCSWQGVKPRQRLAEIPSLQPS